LNRKIVNARPPSAGLWDHQSRAVATALEYLTATEVGDASALITMPTGTGKTGVIAAITTALPEVRGHRLVLTPWKALTVQLISDLRGRFWERLAPRGRPDLLPVRRLPPSTQLDELSDDEPTIFVATIAAISVAAKWAGAGAYDLSEIFSGFGCVLVDEGHYEPAAEWSDAIRALKRRTILLTATPYRNDEKFFNLGEEWRFRFPHWQAEEERFLRVPDFVRLDRQSPESFVEHVVAETTARFDKRPTTRVIIRCATHTSIRRVVGALERLNQSVIGVHERFPVGSPVLRRSVPAPSECDARFWVHQNKLIEGIDDPEFRVLAFYESLGNDRAIVQQIGRVLRNPGRDPSDSAALVIDSGDRSVEPAWRAYRTFDRQGDAESVSTVPEIIERVLAVQPLAFYYDGGYRTRIELDDPDAWTEFAFPLRTRVFRRRVGDVLAPTLDDLESETAHEWRQLDRRVFRTQRPDERTVITPFVTAENSRLLRRGTFIQPEFGYTVIRVDGDLLFLYDSRGNTPRVVDASYQSLRPPSLQALFPSGSSSLTAVSLINTDVGQQAPRSRRIRASAIDSLAPDLADYAYVCTIAEGYTEFAAQRFRRYLGLSQARINDFRSGERDFENYSSWLDSLRDQLANGGVHSATFSRYAAATEIPEAPDPAHVLFDIDPSDFIHEGSGDALDFEDRAVPVTDGSLSMTINGRDHGATLNWDSIRGRYQLTAPSVEDETYITREGQRDELIALINAEQSLRVVPTERTTVYAHGSFFQPVVPATRIGSFRLLDVLYPVDELAAAVSEKGAAIVDDDWDPASVFGLLSAIAPSSGRVAPDPIRRFLEAPDLVICTDLGTEVADFVVTVPGRIVFVHAKASAATSIYSASALHDVASQAIKNLHHLQPLVDSGMATDRWMQAWRTGHVQGSTRRLRHGTFRSGRDIWKHIRSVVSDPGSDREIWLVIGNALSKQELERQARLRPPAAEVLQVYSLLQTTWGAVSQVGARFRVFCSP
jgi:superfamily II DNA or RNA helicase